MSRSARFRKCKTQRKPRNLQRSAPRLDMLKPPAEDTELTRPGNERVRPSLSWRNARQTLHTRGAAFLGFAGLLTAVFIKPLFLLAAGAIHCQLDSYILFNAIGSSNLLF